MALEARRRITPTTTRPNPRNALYGLLIPLELNSGYKSIQKYAACDHGNRIARGLHNGEFWSSGKMVLGGHRWGGVLCRIFPTNSLLTVCQHFGMRAYHCTHGHMGIRPFHPPKKIEKILNTPLRIKTDCDIICGVPPEKGASLFDMSKPQGR